MHRVKSKVYREKIMTDNKSHAAILNVTIRVIIELTIPLPLIYYASKMYVSPKSIAKYLLKTDYSDNAHQYNS